jgi:hypothetical protein
MHHSLATASLLLASITLLPRDGEQFVRSAIVNADDTATLPLHEGRVGERVVWFVVLDASTSNLADRFGCNRSNKLAVAAGTSAVQQGWFDRAGLLHFAGTVDFAPDHLVVPDPVTGFPPLQVRAGSRADSAYSPLVRLPDGSVLNAPHLLNATGRHDKVVAADTAAGTVRFRLTHGFARGHAVLYMSTDASNETAAALEAVTLVPRLNGAPTPGGDGTNSARASLAAFVNGATGASNPQRQGLNSALLGDGDPLNVLAWLPNQGRYSPLWDVHLAAWRAGAVPTRQTEFAHVADLARNGQVTAPDGGQFGPSQFIVDCPIIKSLD